MPRPLFCPEDSGLTGRGFWVKLACRVDRPPGKEDRLKRTLLLAALAVVLFITLPGCTTLYVDSPPGRDVKLLAREVPPSTVYRTKAWFFLWGLVPGEIGVAEHISQHRLDQVRVKSETGVVDWLISAVTGGIVMPRTVVIEGRRN